MYIKTNLNTEVFNALYQLSDYDKETQERIRQTVHDKAAEVHSRAMELAPYGTGDLKTRIGLTFFNNEYKTYASINVADPVGHLIEYGVAKSVEIPIKKRRYIPALKVGL